MTVPEPPASKASDLAPSDLTALGVNDLRVLWCDNANVIRARAVRVREPLRVNVAISQAQMALPVMGDSVVDGSGLGPVGEAQLVPDWTTLRVLPYAPGEAQVLGDLTLGGAPWEHCPRAFLRDQIARLAALGLHVQAAFENEFYLLYRDGQELRPADDTVYAATGSMNLHRPFVHALSDALEALELEPETYHPESGPGQLELSVRHTDALSSADQQIMFREAVRGMAQQNGYVPSFLPKIFESQAGSGCHLNLSLWRGGLNMTGDASHPSGLSDSGRAFIAGLLAHLPALCALSVPSPNSYRRLRPSAWAGAYCTWGHLNREAAVRVSVGGAGSARFELKTSDATANPYLALGSVIAAGLDGIERNLTLPPETAFDPSLLSDAEREAQGIRALPSSLGEAITALEQDEALLAALGAERAQTYLAVRRAEWQAMKDMNLQDEVRLLAERY